MKRLMLLFFVSCMALCAQHTVACSWLAGVGGPPVASFNVKRGTVSGGPYSTLVGNVPAGTLTLVDSSAALVDGATFFYVVSAVGTGGLESANSIESKATLPFLVPPSQPTALQTVAK